MHHLDIPHKTICAENHSIGDFILNLLNYSAPAHNQYGNTEFPY